MGLGTAGRARQSARWAEEVGLPVVLDGRDHRARGVRHARRGRRRGPVARPRHRRARPPAAHPDAGGHGRRHPAGAAPRPRHPPRRRASPRRSSPPGGTACPTATGRSARVREYLTLLRACLSGEKVDFDGDFYEVKGFRLGVALGERSPEDRHRRAQPRMLPLAGELADGVLLNYLPASHVPWSVEQVREGRRPPTVYAYVHAGVCEREEGIELRPARPVLLRRRRRLRPQLRAGRVRRRGRRDPRPRTPPATGRARWPPCRDRMVDAIDVMGDADTVRAHDAGLRRRRRRRAGAHAAAMGRRPAGRRPTPPSGRRRVTGSRACTPRGAHRTRSCVVTGGANGIGRAWRAVRRRGRRGAWPSSTATPTAVVEVAERPRRPSASAWAPTWRARPTSSPPSRATEAALRPDRPVLLQRRHRHDGGDRGARRGLAAHLGRQRDGPRLRGPRRAPRHARPGRGLPPQHRVGRRPAHPDRRRAVHRHQARRRRRSPSGWPSPTATRASRSRACARRA